MGRITCANVLSDLYAMGVTESLNMLMLLGVAKDMTEEERDVVVPMILAGFRDTAWEAGVGINGGQTVLNPWMTIGGVATAVCNKRQLIMPTEAEAGDVLVLTKPLGVQAAITADQYLNDPEQFDKLQKIVEVVSAEQIKETFKKAVLNMATLNKPGAQLMHTHKAHACTDVTGFGLLGHATNLALLQTREVHLAIERVAVLKGMWKVAQVLGGPYNKLLHCLAPETSGGLLVAMGSENAQRYIQELKESHDTEAWVVGKVVAGPRGASVAEKLEVVEV